tara:strand:+ start:298 stop:462 length:165 start_codon:yes stop_codon:yes gene_type:complete
VPRYQRAFNATQMAMRAVLRAAAMIHITPLSKSAYMESAMRAAVIDIKKEADRT